ncbi:MAG: alpha-ribazole phosphatase [Bacteroidota bacterium]
MEIYLIRHTTPDVEKGIVYGQTDLELASSWSDEFNILHEKIPDQFDAVYSSPLIRCDKLAQSITGDVQYDDRIKELDFGDWEMKKWDEINPKMLNMWMEDYVNIACPNGESFNMLSDRVLSFWSQYANVEGDHKSVAIVAHGGVIRALISHLLGFPLINAFHLHLDYGSISKVEMSKSRTQVKFINR